MAGCYVCANELKNARIFPREMFLGTREVFPYILCSACQSLSIESIPANLAELYGKYPGLKHPKRKKSRLRNLMRRYMLLHSNLLAKKLSDRLASFDDLRIRALYSCQLSLDSDILDVGCGSGWFIYELQELGFKKSLGIDAALNEELYPKHSGWVSKRSIFEMEGSFDLITFHHSFEHLEDAGKVLKKVKTLLSENGVCLVRIPNIESWGFRFFKENWSGIHPPYHLFLPSQQGMQILCQKAGLKIIDVRWEQLMESFLRSSCYVLDFASHDKFGTRMLLKDRPLGNRTIPLFTKQETEFWKSKAKKVVQDQLSDYIAYYLKKDQL